MDINGTGQRREFLACAGGIAALFLFGTAVIIGSVIGIWLAIWATRNRHVERSVFFLANITQTIPSLALFGLLIAPLSTLSFSFPFLRELGISGVGTTPALIALVIYSLLPIMRNTFVGLRQVDSAAIDAGLGMGMSRGIGMGRGMSQGTSMGAEA